MFRYGARFGYRYAAYYILCALKHASAAGADLHKPTKGQVRSSGLPPVSPYAPGHRLKGRMDTVPSVQQHDQPERVRSAAKGSRSLSRTSFPQPPVAEEPWPVSLRSLSTGSCQQDHLPPCKPLSSQQQDKALACRPCPLSLVDPATASLCKPCASRPGSEVTLSHPHSQGHHGTHPAWQLPTTYQLPDSPPAGLADPRSTTPTHLNLLSPSNWPGQLAAAGDEARSWPGPSEGPHAWDSRQQQGHPPSPGPCESDGRPGTRGAVSTLFDLEGRPLTRNSARPPLRAQQGLAWGPQPDSQPRLPPTVPPLAAGAWHAAAVGAGGNSYAEAALGSSRPVRSPSATPGYGRACARPAVDHSREVAACHSQAAPPSRQRGPATGSLASQASSRRNEQPPVGLQPMEAQRAGEGVGGGGLCGLASPRPRPRGSLCLGPQPLPALPWQLYTLA
ncbi:hypothetical protein V8C86DRAFT_2464147, partial [Haematococcus lacustris]